MKAVDLQVDTQGGVQDLGRVVNVLALYDLTPLTLRVEAEGDGLRMQMRLEAEEAACMRCIGRLDALPAIVAVRVLSAPVC